MSLIKPFRGLRTTSNHIKQAIAPPYDVLNRAQAVLLAQDQPYSFLHLSKPEIDLANEVDPYDDRVYAKGQENFTHMLNANLLKKDQNPHYYIYQLSIGEHQQTGLVCIASVKAYQQNRICRHEFTQPKKVNDRVRLTLALNAQVSPISLAYRHQDTVQDLLEGITVATTPVYEVLAHDGVLHRLWLVDDLQSIEAISQSVNALSKLYIADGHHRTEMAAQIAQAQHTPAYQYFLAVIFPDTQMRILSYHRIIHDHRFHSNPEALLSNLATHFDVKQSGQPVQPKHRTEFGMYFNDQWYQLHLKKNIEPHPLKSIAVSILHDEIIAPIFDITDPRTDKRISFFGGEENLDEIKNKDTHSKNDIVFTVAPTTIEDLFSVTDHQLTMPTKSTWFSPKLVDGLVSYPYS